MLTVPLFQIKFNIPNTVLLSAYQYSPWLEIHENKTGPVKIDAFGGQNKRSALPDGANFHRSRSWQTVLEMMKYFKLTEANYMYVYCMCEQYAH